MPRKKVVALKLDDGSEIPIADIVGLKRYVTSETLRRELRVIAAAAVDWKTVAKGHEEMNGRRLKNKQTKRVNASKPRKDVSKNELVEHRKNFERDKGSLYGVVKAACKEFRITPKTYKAKIGRS